MSHNGPKRVGLQLLDLKLDADVRLTRKIIDDDTLVFPLVMPALNCLWHLAQRMRQPKLQPCWFMRRITTDLGFNNAMLDIRNDGKRQRPKEACDIPQLNSL